jgi:hypothetical protein
LKNANEEAIENLQRSNSETVGILHNMLTELQGINSGINRLADAMITLAQGKQIKQNFFQKNLWTGQF